MIKNDFNKFWRLPWSIAAGAASQQMMLTPPDIWSCPICDWHLFSYDHFHLSLSCFQTLNFEQPSVLLFCFSPLSMYHCWWTSCPRGYLSGSDCLWNAEKSREQSRLDVAHYKKVSNFHASGHRHVRYGRCPTSSPSGHHQIKLCRRWWQHTMVSECRQVHLNQAMRGEGYWCA